jgi:hypothetical protein
MLAVAAIVAWMFVHWTVAFLLLGLVGVILYVAPQQVKAANPPQIAIPTVWGKPVKKVITPRWTLLLKQAPIAEDVILVDTTQQDDKIIVPDVRCRADESTGNPDDEGGDTTPPPDSGAAATAEVALIYEVSQDPPTHAYDYVMAGQKDGVKSKLKNIVEGAMRQEGSNHTWEVIAFSKARVSAKLIALMTGKNPEHKVKRINGEPVRDTSGSYQTYRLEAVQPHEKLTELDYEAFLKDVLHNGYNDVHGLGIRIRRLYLTQFTPEGMTKEDAELKAREQLQRRGEEIDIGTAIRLATSMMAAANAGLTPNSAGYMTMEQALDRVRVERGRAQQINVGGAGAAAVVTRPRQTGGNN